MKKPIGWPRKKSLQLQEESSLLYTYVASIKRSFGICLTLRQAASLLPSQCPIQLER